MTLKFHSSVQVKVNEWDGSMFLKAEKSPSKSRLVDLSRVLTPFSNMPDPLSPLSLCFNTNHPDLQHCFQKCWQLLPISPGHISTFLCNPTVENLSQCGFLAPSTCGHRGQGAWLLLFSHSAVPDSLRPHGLQHIRLPWLLSSPGACSNSCPLS